MRSRVLVLAAAMVLAAPACDQNGTGPDEAVYTIAVGDEQFRIRARGAQTIGRLEQRMRTGTTGVIMGRVAVGDAGYNAPWSWHLVPSTIEVPDMSIELCDGTPGYVEANLGEWMAQVKSYCPWGARVVARVSP